ncbi:MAG: hypothetical protein DRG71_07235 [Deltaproteobacteria bacterium]|nr:MAG: hypothetical protein DRG71_07235 [Deltaproteobacteria bacterium]
MFKRIRNSWELVKASASVLRADKELVIFPIVSGIGVIVVTLSFAFPMLLAGFFDALLKGHARVFGLVVGLLFYTVQYFVIIFSNAALVGAATIRLEGGDPTVRDGFRIAWQHIGAILGYALIAATVGMILRWLSERGKTLGRITSSILGLAWNLATYLVVPVLVIEGVGPLEAIRRSANLLRKTWGEQIVGNFSLGALFGFLGVAITVPFVAIAILAFSHRAIWLGTIVVLLTVMTIVLLGLISSTLNGIYVAAVYRYATRGETGGFFDEHLIKEAFRPQPQ